MNNQQYLVDRLTTRCCTRLTEGTDFGVLGRIAEILFGTEDEDVKSLRRAMGAFPWGETEATESVKTVDTSNAAYKTIDYPLKPGGVAIRLEVFLTCKQQEILLKKVPSSDESEKSIKHALRRAIKDYVQSIGEQDVK